MSTASNRRAFMRRSPKRSSKITCRKGALGLGPNIGVRLLDLSEAGLRMIVKKELTTKDEVEIGLMAPGGVRETICKGRVVWVVPTADGEFAVGILFEKRLPYTNVIDLSSIATG
jgi:hypothetical protein